jgi:putative transposase
VIYAAIAGWAEEDDNPYTVVFMCAELGVWESGFYRWKKAGPSAHDRFDEELSAVIKHLHARLRGNPGVRRVHAGLAAMGYATSTNRVHAGLAAMGYATSTNRVHRLMGVLGLQGRHPRTWRPLGAADGPVTDVPDLIGQDFTAEGPNQKWCGDIPPPLGGGRCPHRDKDLAGPCVPRHRHRPPVPGRSSDTPWTSTTGPASSPAPSTPP